MSTSATLALISAFGLIGTLIYFHFVKLAVDEFKTILTGVIRGVPVSVNARSLLLYTAWLSYIIAMVVLSTVGAVVNVKIAHYAADPGVKPVAYLVAFFFAVGAFFPVLNGTINFRFLRSVLRESQRD